MNNIAKHFTDITKNQIFDYTFFKIRILSLPNFFIAKLLRLLNHLFFLFQFVFLDKF